MEAIHLDGLSASRFDEMGAALRFYADVVVHGSAYLLLAAEVAFRCLHPNVPQKELDLIQHARLLVPLRRHPTVCLPDRHIRTVFRPKFRLRPATARWFF